MELAKYVEFIKAGAIPPEEPDMTTNSLLTLLHTGKYDEVDSAKWECRRRGVWPVVTLEWIGELADWIGDRSVLEIMAGAGYLAKGLSALGVSIVATDDESWEDGDYMHNSIVKVFPVRKMGAVEAARKLETDILLCSWPPIGERVFAEACAARENGPIVYIGETRDGATASEEFFDGFVEDGPRIRIPTWPGVYDRIWIGYWGGGGKNADGG